MPLTYCIECNNQISDSAQSCPSCFTKEPFGVLCEMCGVRLPRSKGITSVRLETGLDSCSNDILAHKECLERYFTPPSTVKCPDCGFYLSGSDVTFSAKELWSASNKWVASRRCPKCGAADPLGKPLICCKCRAPLYPFQMGPNGQGHGHPTSD